MIEPSGFRELTRSATVTYPIPFAFALLLAFSVLALGGALVARGVMQWVMVGFAGVGFGVGCSMFVGCMIWRPRLLRSERQEIRHRIMDMVADSDTRPDAVELGRLLLDDPVKKKSRAGSQTTPKRGDRDDEG